VKPTTETVSQSAAPAEASRPNLSGTLPTRAGNSQDGMLRQDEGTPQTCFVCGGKAEDSGWFCQIPGEEKRIVLCSPYCALSYFGTANNTCGANGHEVACDDDGVHFLVNGE